MSAFGHIKVESMKFGEAPGSPQVVQRVTALGEDGTRIELPVTEATTERLPTEPATLILRIKHFEETVLGE